MTTGSGQTTGLEALLRWNHPLHGPIYPMVSVRLAEQSGMIRSIGLWVLQQACEDLKSWHHLPGGADLGIAVNVSARQLTEDGFVEAVTAVLAATETAARRLTLEITHSVPLTDRLQALKVLTELRFLGITIALDDFGSGYSALAYLQTFPIDILKIDRSFVAAIDQTPTARRIIAAVVQLAHGLGMTVTTEGVETAAQLEAVAELGSTSSQGYFFARPMSAPAVMSLIGDGGRLPTYQN